MILQQIADTLQQNVQSGQLVLNATTIDAIRIGEFLQVLNAPNFTFLNAEITTSENRVALTGKSSLLGAQNIGLAIVFSEDNGAISVNLSAALPNATIPGASWLSLEDVRISLSLATSTTQITGTIIGVLSTGSERVEITLTLEAGMEVVWRTEVSRISLSGITQAFLNNASSPSEFPNVEFSNIAISITPATRAFSLNATSTTQWNFANSRNALDVQVGVTVNRTVMEDSSSQIDANIQVAGISALTIVEEVVLSNFNLNFLWSGSDWSLSGDVSAQLYEQMFALSASYAQKGDIRTLMLTAATSTRELVNLRNVGSLNLSHLEIFIERQAGETSSWQVSGSGSIRVNNVFDLAGNLTLAQRDDGNTSLMFMPENSSVAVSLPPDRQMSVMLDFDGFTIVRRNADWMFTAMAGLAFQGWRPSVQQILPSRIEVQFEADSNSVRVSAGRAIAPFDFDIPDIVIDDNIRVQVGAARIEVTDLFIQLGSEVELGAKIGLGLPSQLNNIFGVRSDGHPNIEFFNTFNPADPENTVVELQLSIGTSGIIITPTTSLIRGIRIVEENGASYWYVDMEEFGEVKFQIPEFSYDTTNSSFTASGDFETVRPLSIPLTLFKNLIATGLEALSNRFPDALPLQELSILDDRNNFRVTELTALLQQFLNTQLPEQAVEALQLISERFDRLPEQFRQYLNIQIPQSFSYNIAVTPEGSVRLDAHVQEGDEPIRLLYPTLAILPGLPVPILIMYGIELRGISYGVFSGGSLFLLQIDANIDQFDIITLAASLALPNDASLPFPSTRDLQGRLVLKNLFLVIIYETVIPIPIPLFYENLGIEYLGLEGLGLKAHAQFPMPSLNLSEVSQIISQFRRFFTDRNFLLDTSNPPQNFNLRFSLDGNYIRLPQYLGGAMLGPGENGPEINAYSSVASLLNGVKTFSLNELIQAVPLQYRVGNTNTTFASLSSNMRWLISTPNEFRQPSVYRTFGFIGADQAERMLTLLPPTSQPSSRDEQGLVALLNGKWSVGQLATLDAAFALGASGSSGFNTSFRIAGNIQNFIDLEMFGRVAINASTTNPVFYSLSFDGQNDYVRLENPASLNISGQICIEAWIRPEVTNGLRNIIAHGNSFAPNAEVFLRINDGNYQVGSWDGQNYLATAPIPQGDIGRWVHLAGVYDGATWRLYRNGVEVSMTRTARGAIPVNESWAIGARGTGTERFFQGQIDEVRIWNRTRSNSEIQTDMSRRLRGNEIGLVGYWSLNEGRGDRANDQTTNRNTGLIIGSQWQQPGAPIVSPLTDPSRDALQIVGQSRLSILNRRIFDGNIELRNNNFWLSGNLDLFPANSLLQVQGTLNGALSNSELQLMGSVNTNLAGLRLLNAKAMISNNQVLLEGNWLGITTTLNVQQVNQALAVRGGVNVDVRLSNISIGPINLPTRQITLATRINLNTQVNARVNVNITNSGFSATVSGRFSWNGTTWQLPAFTVNLAFQSVEELANLITDRIRATAYNIFNQLFRDAASWVNAIKNRVIQFTGNVAEVLRNGFNQVAEDTARFMNTLNFTTEQVGQALKDVYQQTASQVVDTINSVYGRFSAEQVANLLRNIGYTAIETGQVLRNFYKLGAEEVFDIINRLYFNSRATADQAASVLRDIGFSVRDVAFLINDVFKLSVDNLRSLLTNVFRGVSPSVIASILAEIFRNSIPIPPLPPLPPLPRLPF
ncbi:LamG domain-containing protein [Calothrix sp. NIES-4071]|nr:LamG domain-containing protein [Calothrix sp. NIES-4071]BAZ54518.1 LamG domain-containing protein [Calothrix sp. NIES-4105]